MLKVIREYVVAHDLNKATNFSVRAGRGRAGSIKFEERVVKAAINADKKQLIKLCNVPLASKNLILTDIFAPFAYDEASKRTIADITLFFETKDGAESLLFTIPVNIKYTTGTAKDNTAGKKAMFGLIYVGADRQGADKFALIESAAAYIAHDDAVPVFRDYFFLYFAKPKKKDSGERAAKSSDASSVLTTKWDIDAPRGSSYGFNANQSFPHVQMKYPTSGPDICNTLFEAQERYFRWTRSHTQDYSMRMLRAFGGVRKHPTDGQLVFDSSGNLLAVLSAEELSTILAMRDKTSGDN